MTVSMEALSKWLESNGMTAEGSQESYDKATELLRMIRESSSTGGDNRNVHDFLKELSSEEIAENLAESRSGLVSVFANLLGDFNLASGVRNVNWFNGHSALIAGRRRWDRRGAVGTQNYTEVNYNDSLLDVIAEYRALGYRIVAAEINDSAVPLTTYEWQDKSVVIYGEEGAGLSEEVLGLVDDIVFIPGRGSVRSLNVATTNGIFTYDYSMKMGYLD